MNAFYGIWFEKLTYDTLAQGVEVARVFEKSPMAENHKRKKSLGPWEIEISFFFLSHYRFHQSQIDSIAFIRLKVTCILILLGENTVRGLGKSIYSLR